MFTMFVLCILFIILHGLKNNVVNVGDMLRKEEIYDLCWGGSKTQHLVDKCNLLGWIWRDRGKVSSYSSLKE